MCVYMCVCMCVYICVLCMCSVCISMYVQRVSTCMCNRCGTDICSGPNLIVACSQSLNRWVSMDGPQSVTHPLTTLIYAVVPCQSLIHWQPHSFIDSLISSRASPCPCLRKLQSGGTGRVSRAIVSLEWGVSRVTGKVSTGTQRLGLQRVGEATEILGS